MLLTNIVDILWPEDDPYRSWTSETIDQVATELERHGLAPEPPAGGGREE